MNKYEVMFIIDPVLEDDKKEAVIETVKGIIAAAGEVADTDIWGLRKLAYPMLDSDFSAENNILVFRISLDKLF